MERAKSLDMTKSQQEAQRELDRAQAKWLIAYGWSAYRGYDAYGSFRWTHRSAPSQAYGYSTRDAMELTRAEPLRYVP
jgi:hypothetical protein